MTRKQNTDSVSEEIRFINERKIVLQTLVGISRDSESDEYFVVARIKKVIPNYTNVGYNNGITLDRVGTHLDELFEEGLAIRTILINESGERYMGSGRGYRANLLNEKGIEAYLSTEFVLTPSPEDQ